MMSQVVYLPVLTVAEYEKITGLLAWVGEYVIDQEAQNLLEKLEALEPDTLETFDDLDNYPHSQEEVWNEYGPTAFRGDRGTVGDYYDNREQHLEEMGLQDDPGQYYREALTNPDGTPIF